jgi:hypothetical protein
LQILWQQRDDALRLGLVPTLIFFGGLLYARDTFGIVAALVQTQVETGVPSDPPPGVAGPLLVAFLAIVVSICLVTANWLRYLLLGPMGAVGLGLSIGATHLRFLLAAIGLGVAMLVASAILSQPLVLVPGAMRIIGMMLVAAVVLALMARFLPFVVGQAIGQSMSLAQSWRVSRGNGASLAISLILVQLPIGIVYAVLDLLLEIVGFAVVAPVAMIFVFAVAQTAVSVAQAGVLANAYRHMVGVRV